MSFELDSRGADDLDEVARSRGVPLGTMPEPAGPLSGVATAPVKGLVSGLVMKPNLLLGDAATTVLRPGARALDSSLGTRLDSWLDEQERSRVQLVEHMKPDPVTTGMAGKIVHGFFDIGSSALLFTPEGAAVLEGNARRQELRAQGVDDTTAAGAGAVTAAATYVGVKAPLTLGTAAGNQGARAIATNAGFGGTVSVASGVGERLASREILSSAGYKDQAALIEPFDKQAMAAELILGALFSGGASAIEYRSSIKSQHAIDAARATQTAKHVALDTAPGHPVDTLSMAAHERAMTKALDQVLAGERVNVGDTLADAAFVRDVRPEAVTRREEIRSELRSHVADIEAARATPFEPEVSTALSPLAPRTVAPAGVLAIEPGRQGIPDEVAAGREAQAIPMVKAAADVADRRPDLQVVLEDGSRLTAREALDRVYIERAGIKKDAAAYEAAVHCFLRN